MNSSKTTRFYPNHDKEELDAEALAFLERLAPDWDAGAARAKNARALSPRSPSPRSVPGPSPAGLRKENSVAAWAGPADEGVALSDLVVDGPGGPLPLRLYRPGVRQRAPEGLPVLVYFHGGGFVFGGIGEGDAVCAALAARTPCIVLSVGYRLAPEHPFPAALEDARAALAWASSYIDSYGGDRKRIGVAGESAGANLAARLCIEARDGSLPMPACQLLLSPWLDLADLDRPSHRAFGEGPWLSIASLTLYREWYLGTAPDPAAPEISPLRTADLSRLPPAAILVTGIDPLRDEGLEYARALALAGTETHLIVEEGMIHSFFVLGRVISRARPALDRAARALAELFERSES